MKRSATAVWKGSGKDGSGHITSQSHAIYNANYAWNTRFEDEKGTNPEELIAAAHAGCFTMKLSFLIGEAGFTPEMLSTKCEVTMANGVISHSELTVMGNVPGISKEKFEECANNAKENCPVSKALNLQITMQASLNESLGSNNNN